MGTDGGPRDPSSCPSLSHEGGGAVTLQSSLELGKGSPSCGLCPSLPAVPGSLAGVGDEERRTAHTDGAWCRLLLSWRGSKSNILQGRYFPCSAHAQFKRPLCSSKRASGLLFLMHTVKGKKITVIHLLRACRHQILLLHHQRKEITFAGGDPAGHSLPTGHCAGGTGTRRGQLPCTVPPGHLCPAL